jgi:hypothetical protein
MTDKNKQQRICEVDLDEAFYLGGGEDGVYFDAEEGPGGWYTSSVVDCNSGHFIDSLVTDDGPYGTRAEALQAALNGSAYEWLVTNHVRGWRTGYAKYVRQFKRMAKAKKEQTK